MYAVTSSTLSKLIILPGFVIQAPETENNKICHELFEKGSFKFNLFWDIWQFLGNNFKSMKNERIIGLNTLAGNESQITKWSL